MWHFLNAVEASDVVKCVNARGETSVEAEDLVIDEGSKREVVEQVCEELPDVGIAIFAQALVVEAVHLCDLSRFMVTAQDGDSGRISNFEGNEKCDGFDGVVASINVVACSSS
jgi:hypothetical protein